MKNPEPTGGWPGVPERVLTLGRFTDAARTSGGWARNSRHANGSNVLSGDRGAVRDWPNSDRMNGNAAVLYCTLVYSDAEKGRSTPTRMSKSNPQHQPARNQAAANSTGSINVGSSASALAPVTSFAAAAFPLSGLALVLTLCSRTRLWAHRLLPHPASPFSVRRCWRRLVQLQQSQTRGSL
jgi:hypothetical protein